LCGGFAGAVAAVGEDGDGVAEVEALAIPVGGGCAEVGRPSGRVKVKVPSPWPVIAIRSLWWCVVAA